MKKKYKFGLVIGRFQPLHNGHAAILKKAAEECVWVFIGIGSAQEDGTKRNPYTYTFRKNILHYFWDHEQLDAIPIFMPLVDIGAGDSPIWGKYLINSCIYYTNKYSTPEVYYTGSEIDRNNWLKEYPNIKVEVVNRQDIPISSTIIREKIVNNDPTWKELVPKCIIENEDFKEYLEPDIKEAYKND